MSTATPDIQKSLIQQTLSTRFGFDSLRPGQHEVIADVLDGQQVISVMPTGAGKSLCYQLPGALLAANQGFTLVVSPLIALMKDQVDSLTSRNISAAALTSAASMDEQSQILAGIRTGEFEILYVAPERFHSSRFMSALHDAPKELALLAIDEAHCISEWGHDFRPAYRLLGKAIIDLRPPRLLAVTATATPEVRSDIAHQLGMQNPSMHVRGFSRHNLTFSVEHTGGIKDKTQRILEKLQEQNKGCSLVYAATRKNAEHYASEISAIGLRARAYHAGLEDQHRAAIQDEFMSGDLNVIVATNAFGMGVDKNDVRLVIHADLTRSIEAYYQEAGRAGRDTHPADCILMFNHGDVRLQEFLIDASFPTAELLRSLWKTLRERPGRRLEEIQDETLPGDPHESTLRSALRILGRHGYLQEESGRYQAVHPTEIQGDYPDFDAEASERRAQVERNKLQRMVEYAYHPSCRHGFVLDYFGEDRKDKEARCQICDNCQGNGAAQGLSNEQVEQAESILAVVKELGGRFGRKRIACVANGSDDDERFYGLPHRGSLAGTSQKSILALLRALEAGRLIEQSRGEYPTIGLTSHGKRIVSGGASLDPELLRIIPASKRRPKSTTQKTSSPKGPIDSAMANRLRKLRTELAEQQSVPAYVIFSNKTLDELSIVKPKTHNELKQVHGIGPSRVEKYGDAIVSLMTS